MAADQRLATVLAGLADTLRPDFDERTYAEDLARRAVGILEIDAALVLLTGEHGRISATAERTHVVGGRRAIAIEGPPEEALRRGEAVGSPDLRSETRWPRFTLGAVDDGFAAAHAVPLRLREQRVGSLTLLWHGAGLLDERTCVIGQALADTAAAALMARRSLGAAQTLAGQLQTALDTRITIEQAKGILAARRGSNVDSAFEMIRSMARRHRRRIADVARDVIDDASAVAHLAAHGDPAGRTRSFTARDEVSSGEC